VKASTDFLVIGSGIAGLSFALRAARHGEVVVVTKRASDDAATSWAQGGVAAVLGPEDSFQKHAEDTKSAGAGLCHDATVDLCVREAPDAIRWLSDLGASFSTTTGGDLDLGREGGHSERRVVHAGDITGREIQRALLAAVRENPNIRLLEWHMGVDLIMLSSFGGPEVCAGAYVLDEARGVVDTIVARATVLATGGAGKVYLYTSNPDVATGDGIAMAYRVGAKVGNMEFFQFHPTCLYHPAAKSFLLTEAMRGEGGILRLRNGHAFMAQYHPMKDLAPRDVVARAIDNEMKRTGDDFVHLDVTHLPAGFVEKRFPAIFSRCLELGIDIRKQAIPVVPAAHYSCGGVVVDENGATSVPNLYAIGETSMTGLHGACRLASNSLLEAMVYAARAAAHVKTAANDKPPYVTPWYAGEATSSDEAVVVSQNWDEIRRLMWNYVGIVRSDRRLERAHRRIRLIREEIRDYYWHVLVSGDLIELRNLALVAELVIESARRRPESRGLHYNLDHPGHNDAYAHDTVLARRDGPRA
jgi:L-aspartate oxidase